MVAVNKYLDEKLRLLDPRSRELEPARGDMGGTALQIKGIDQAARTVTAIASTPNIDRYEEMVEPKAFEEWLPVFEQNPVLCAGHTYSGWNGEATVIGHWGEMKITKEGLLGTARFADTDLANDYWKLYAAGHMRAFSVGWLTHEWEMREYELAAGVNKKIRVFTEVELIEISAVAIPANREALVRAASATRTPGTPGPGPGTKADDDALIKALVDQLAPALKAQINDDVREVISKLLTDPYGPMQGVIRDVVAACGHEDHGGHHHDVDPGSKRSAEQQTDLQRHLAEIQRQIKA